MTFSHDDALFEIFSWLPAKAIYKFKSTAKLFSKFSEETYFAMRQAQNALLKDDSCFFIHPNSSPSYNGNTELHPLPGEDLSSSSSGVSNDVIRLFANSAKILCSSNGLVLCRATRSWNKVDLFIINPATQSWFPIPTLEHLQKYPDAEIKIVLECDNDNCMVLLFYGNNPDEWKSLDCKVYQTKEGVWKTREERFFTGGRNLRFDMPVFHNGAFHFISDCSKSYNKRSPYFRPYIMSYNFESGMSTMLRVPKEARRGSHDYSCEMGLFKWGKATCSTTQSICLVRLRKSVFTIWVLTKYETSSWKRVVKVRVKAMLGLMERDPIVTGFTVLNGDLLVFATEKKKVYGYGLSTNEKYRMRAEEICENRCECSKVCLTSYSNTLRACGADARALLLPHSNIIGGTMEQPHDSFSFLSMPYTVLFLFLLICIYQWPFSQNSWPTNSHP